MLECLIMGDSIAVGTHMFKKECVLEAKGGLNSWQYNKQYVEGKPSPYSSQVVLISLGSNDHAGVKTYNELYKMRQAVKAQRVYWILPNPVMYPKQSEEVKLIAITFGDQLIETKRYQADKIHPSWAGYKELADQAK